MLDILIFVMWARNGIDLLLQAYRARRGMVICGLLKNDDQKLNANLNRLVNADFSFDVNNVEIEFAVAA